MHYLPTDRTLQTCTKMYMWGPKRDLEGLSDSQKGLLGFHQERQGWEPRPPASWGQHLLPRTPGQPALAKGLSHLCDRRTGQSIPTTHGGHPCRQNSSTSFPPTPHGHLSSIGWDVSLHLRKAFFELRVSACGSPIRTTRLLRDSTHRLTPPTTREPHEVSSRLLTLSSVPV